jgi:putative ABC transport system permease protein
MGAATLRPYAFFEADIMISAGDANAIAEGGNVARQWMLQVST